MAQAMHAALAFFYTHRSLAEKWMLDSNYLVVVNAPTEESLLKVLDKADQKRISAVPFFEEDLDNELTAVALQPGIVAQKICAQFPLALRDGVRYDHAVSKTSILGRGAEPRRPVKDWSTAPCSRKDAQGSLKAQRVDSNSTGCSSTEGLDLRGSPDEGVPDVSYQSAHLERDEVPA